MSTDIFLAQLKCRWKFPPTFFSQLKRRWKFLPTFFSYSQNAAGNFQRHFYLTPKMSLEISTDIFLSAKITVLLEISTEIFLSAKM